MAEIAESRNDVQQSERDRNCCNETHNDCADDRLSQWREDSRDSTTDRSANNVKRDHCEERHLTAGVVIGEYQAHHHRVHAENKRSSKAKARSMKRTRPN